MPEVCESERGRFEALSLSAALTIVAMVLPDSLEMLSLWRWLWSPHYAWLQFHRFADGVLILLGLVLVLPAPRASGLCIGDIRKHWKGVLLVVGGPVLLTAIVYPNLPNQPFHNVDLTIWLTSPVAQDLIFGGVIYRLIRPHFSTRVHRKLPFEWALPVGGLFFAGWHLQNFMSFSPGYVCFQLLYTWAAFTIVGLTRQWTGSLIYVTIAHMSGNFIAWWSGGANVW